MKKIYFCLLIQFFFLCSLRGGYTNLKSSCLNLLAELRANGPIVQPMIIDEAKKQEWLATQPKKYRDIMKKIVDGVEQISTGTFLEKFDVAVNQFKQTIEKDEKIIFVTFTDTKDYKSGDLMGGYLFERHPELSQYPLISVRDAYDDLETNYSDVRLVFLDDASYTGSDLFNITKTLQSKSPKAVDALLAYATKRVVDKVSSQESLRSVYYGDFLRGVEDVLSEAEVSQLPSALRNFSGRDLLNQSLQLLPHKVPDSLSFPEMITEGYILREDGERFVSEEGQSTHVGPINRGIKFFDTGLNPYKEVFK